jgi:hypothetical protein
MQGRIEKQSGLAVCEGSLVTLKNKLTVRADLFEFLQISRKIKYYQQPDKNPIAR